MQYKYWLTLHRWLALVVALQLLLWLGSGLVLSFTGHASSTSPVAPQLPTTENVPALGAKTTELEHISISRQPGQTGWLWERRVAGETSHWHAPQQQWQTLLPTPVVMSVWQDWAYRLHFMDYDGADLNGRYDFNHSLVRGFGVALLLLSISGWLALVRVIRRRQLWPPRRPRHGAVS